MLIALLMAMVMLVMMMVVVNIKMIIIQGFPEKVFLHLSKVVIKKRIFYGQADRKEGGGVSRCG